MSEIKAEEARHPDMKLYVNRQTGEEVRAFRIVRTGKDSSGEVVLFYARPDGAPAAGIPQDEARLAAFEVSDYFVSFKATLTHPAGWEFLTGLEFVERYAEPKETAARRRWREDMEIFNPIPEKPAEERLLKWFRYDHLPERLRGVSKEFGDLAVRVCAVVAPGPERTVALRKLLEAKDAAVRATLAPGG